MNKIHIITLVFMFLSSSQDAQQLQGTPCAGDTRRKTKTYSLLETRLDLSYPVMSKQFHEILNWCFRCWIFRRAIPFCFALELNCAAEVTHVQLKSRSAIKKIQSIINTAGLALRQALTLKVDILPFEHTLLVLLFHPFIPHAKGLLRGAVLYRTIWY